MSVILYSLFLISAKFNKLKAQYIFSEVKSGCGVETEVEDHHDVLEDSKDTENAGLAVGDVSPVAEHAGQNGHQVEDQKDFL